MRTSVLFFKRCFPRPAGGLSTWNLKMLHSTPQLQLQLPGALENPWCLVNWQPENMLVDTSCHWGHQVEQEVFRAWLSRRNPGATDRYRMARKTADVVVVEWKHWAWEELKEATEKDFCLASEVVENSSVIQKGLIPGCVWFGQQIALLDCDLCQTSSIRNTLRIFLIQSPCPSLRQNLKPLGSAYP